VIHVFATKRDTAAAIAGEVRAATSDAPPPLGDAFPRSRDIHATRDDLAATYGPEFTDAVGALPPGVWSEPIPSRFGWHLVKVIDHDAGRLASFDEVAAKVRLELTVERRHAAIANYIDHAFARYRVDISGQRVRALVPTERLALRAEPSAED
jgi:hypothetical protein